MNTRETSGRSYKDILTQAVHSLADSTGLQAAIEAIDASFQQKGLHVLITGRKPQAQKTLGRPVRAFNPTGSRLVFAFLCQPGLENKSYREMATEAGISLGAVNWIINDLKSLGHLVDLGGRGRRLVKRKELLKRWTSAYPEQLRPKIILGRFRTKHTHDGNRRTCLRTRSGAVKLRRSISDLKPLQATRSQIFRSCKRNTGCSAIRMVMLSYCEDFGSSISGMKKIFRPHRHYLFTPIS